jgi:hypothetical protein
VLDLNDSTSPRGSRSLHCRISIRLMSAWGHLQALPHRNSNGWFTSISRHSGVEMPCS